MKNKRIEMFEYKRRLEGNNQLWFY